jgi:hypothetical protein
MLGISTLSHVYSHAQALHAHQALLHDRPTFADFCHHCSHGRRSCRATPAAASQASESTLWKVAAAQKPRSLTKSGREAKETSSGLSGMAAIIYAGQRHRQQQQQQVD